MSACSSSRRPVGLYTIATYDSLTETRPERIAVTFDELVQMLEEPGGMLSGGLMHVDTTRSDANFETMKVLFLDKDEGELTIEQAAEVIKTHCWLAIIVPTKSHNIEKNGIVCERFRIVMPLARPIGTKQELEGVFSKMTQIFGPLDPCGKIPSQAYFRPPQKVKATVIQGTDLLDPHIFFSSNSPLKGSTALQLPTPHPPARSETNFGHVLEGQRNQTLAANVGAWIREGLTQAEVLGRAQQWNMEYNHPPQPQHDVWKTVESVIKTAERNGNFVPLVQKQNEITPLNQIDGQNGLEMALSPREAPPWAVPGIARNGDNIVVGGPAKSQKTMLMTDIALGSALGEDILGFGAPTPMRIAVVQAEMPLWLSGERHNQHPFVQKALETEEGRSRLSNNLYVTDRLATMLLDPNGVRCMIQALATQFPDGLDGLWIDSLSAVFDGDDENANAQMAAFLRDRVGAFRIAFGQELLIGLVHHAAKVDMKVLQNDPFLALRGASYLRGWYTTGLVLHRDPRDRYAPRHLHFEMRAGIEPEPIRVCLEDGMMRRVDLAEIDAEALLPKAVTGAEWAAIRRLIEKDISFGVLHTINSFVSDYAGGKNKSGITVGVNRLRNHLKHQIGAGREGASSEVIDVPNPWPSGHRKRGRIARVLCLPGYSLEQIDGTDRVRLTKVTGSIQREENSRLTP